MILILFMMASIGTCVPEARDIQGRPTIMICNFKDGYYRTFKAVPDATPIEEPIISLDYEPEILMEEIIRLQPDRDGSIQYNEN